MALASGAPLGPYEIIAQIGAGGMGEVYKARDPRLNRLIALKILPASAVADVDRGERFVREAQAIAALNHPNIVTIYSVEQADGQFCLAMELIEGRSLDEAIPPNGLPLDRLLSIAIPVLDAVVAAHQKRITHRDLKPANIMIGEGEQAGRIKVLDFGLAKFVEAPIVETGVTTLPTKPITGDGRIVGTVAYMSPEQAEGRPIDARSDLFSLGVILFEMATGHRPFEGETSISIISSIIKDTPRSVTELNPRLPAEFGRIVRRALSKDRERRYQTAKDLRNDLQVLADDLNSGTIALRPLSPSTGFPTTSPPAPRPERDGIALPSDAEMVGHLVKQYRRSLIFVTAAASVLVAATGYWWLSRPSTTVLDTLHVTQLTSTGNAATPAISPDGKYVAYIQRDADRESLWIRQTATTSNVQVLPAEQNVRLSDPTITPDGTFIDVTRWPAGGTRGLSRVAFLGGSPVQVLGHVDSAIGWSPSAKQLAFVRGDRELGSTSVIVANADGSHERIVSSRRLPDGGFLNLAQSGRPSNAPAWSPDGRTIAALTFNARAIAVMFINVANGVTHLQDLSGIDDARSVVWLNNDALLINAAGDSLYQLWLLSVHDGRLSRLTNDIDSYIGASVTANRDQLVTARVETRVSLWVGTSGAERGGDIDSPAPFAGPPARGLVAWAGDSLLYTVSHVTHRSIQRVDVTRHTTTELVVNGSDPTAGRSAWPIVYAGDPSDAAQAGLWRIDREGAAPSHIVSERATLPLVTSDQRMIVYLSNRSGVQTLWGVPLAGGSPYQITSVFVGALGWDISPDGKLLFRQSSTTREGSRQRAWIVCELPSCKEPVQTVPLPDNRQTGVARWTPDGQAIAYVDSGQLNIWVQPIKGTPPHQLTHFTDGRTITDFVWSLDGSRLAVVRATTTSDIVLFKGLQR